MKNAINLEDIKRSNRTTVLEILHNNAPISRSEIATISGLTKTSVTNIINELLNYNYIDEVGTETTKSGRRKTLLKIKKDSFKILGVSISRRYIYVGLFDADSNLLYENKKDFSSKNTNFESESILFECIDELLKNSNTKISNINGIGVSIPAPVNPILGKVIATPSYYEAWKNISIKDILIERYGINTWIDNDANVGALSEKWYGIGKNYKNFVYLVADVGLGSGIIINNSLYRGSSYMSGEIGHTFINDFIKKDEFNFIEEYSGIRYILNKYKGIDFEYFLNNYSKNKDYEKDMNIMIDLISISILNIITLIDPQAIILGGSLSYLKEILLNRVNNNIKKYLFGPIRTKIIINSEFEKDILKGSSALVLEKLFSDPYKYLLK
ncbi:ROK family transcriptional regulator [Oceanotoga sp. DSM 15011]|uniref:ROK family transcriptional regulator n=1 Tax=Oceanotoga TaxID=1255275 RepID=UPI0021F48197|nr:MULTISPECIES: ROK family transcriptional regulator [Oceanotoga]MDO7977909.1 ROK family transcriptional regulator [Oceanotoga teriensis]UYP00485.1 ROK family transcriptional regulator [Oceanotoga sp. DSM 15011]